MKDVHRKFISLMGVRLCDRCGQGPIAGKAAMEAHNAVACPNPRKKGEEEEKEAEKDTSKGEKVRHFERDYSITYVHYLRVHYFEITFPGKGEDQIRIWWRRRGWPQHAGTCWP